jgi:TrmH family RNA methyltransferase
MHGCFVAEGSKLVLEMVQSHFSLQKLFATADWIKVHIISSEIPIEEVKPSEMERISSLSTASSVLAIVNIPEEEKKTITHNGDLTLVLDGIRDPGNMGTIVRIADWFGIHNVYCSTNCVDIYNPKVIQSSMGSIARVNVRSVELAGFFESLEKKTPVYGMMLEGEDIFHADIEPQGIIVIGSEAHGISEEISGSITHKLTIPFFPRARESRAESLNAAVATGIVCAEFRKRLASTY